MEDDLYSNHALPKYPAPSGFIESAAIPSDKPLKVTSFSAQSKPSASLGRLSTPDSTAFLDSFESDCGPVLDCDAPSPVWEFDGGTPSRMDTRTESKSTPGSKEAKAVSNSRTRSSAAERLLRILSAGHDLEVCLLKRFLGTVSRGEGPSPPCQSRASSFETIFALPAMLRTRYAGRLLFGTLRITH
jgi:hypothetical protein